MATLIKGLLAHNLDWQFVMVGVALAATIELCGVSSLSFAVGAYLPLSTTAPIFVGGVVRAFAERARRKRRRARRAHADDRARPRQPVRDRPGRGRRRRGRRGRDAERLRRPGEGPGHKIALEHPLVERPRRRRISILGLLFFAAMAGILWRVARQKTA